MKVIPRTNYRRLPWRNGLGITEEVAIEPLDTDFTKGEFLWRISTAAIDRASDFSSFPGYDRTLVLFEGDGLNLAFKGRAAESLLPFKPLCFSGDESVSCELHGSAVSDLNIFVRRDNVRSQVTSHKIDSEISWNPEGAWNFVFCATGSVEASTVGVNHRLNARDSLFTKMPLHLKGAAQVILIEFFLRP